MMNAEVAIIVLGLILVGATVWVPSLSGRTKVLLLLLAMAAAILVVLHQMHQLTGP
jgi:hypothetical protein